MMRRIICLSLCFVFAFNITSLATFDNDIDSFPVWSESLEAFNSIENMVKLNLDSEAAILMHEDTGTILYTKNEHEKLRPASVTKIMTLLLIMEALDRGEIKLSDEVSCSQKAREMGGSQIWLDETEKLTVHEMLKAICVVSANDCCVAMSEYVSGSEEAFVQKMNDRAKELGMNDTTFKNCHGIDEDGHLTSAYDIALMSRELSMNHPEIHEYTKIWMDTLRDGKSQLVNTNKLVRFYSGCTGLKTGSTSVALFNLSATANRNDFKLIAVVMRATTSQKRFDDARTLLDYGFANFSNSVIVKKDEVIESIEIAKSDLGSVDVVAENDLCILLKKGTEKDIVTEIVYDANLSAPLEYKEKVGTINCYVGDTLVGHQNLVLNEEVKRKNIVDFMDEMIKFLYLLGR